MTTVVGRLSDLLRCVSLSTSTSLANPGLRARRPEGSVALPLETNESFTGFKMELQNCVGSMHDNVMDIMDVEKANSSSWTSRMQEMSQETVGEKLNK